MHDTALEIGSAFMATYCRPEHAVILEIGSLNVNGSLRVACPKEAIYLGLDNTLGDGVDIKANMCEPLPIRSDFSDITISTSQMEHDPQFWSTFLELCRVTKSGGYIYMNAPSNGPYHAYPEDMWRFYPDSGNALVAWARQNGHDVTLLESFTAPRKDDVWNDYVAIFQIGHLTSPISFLADRFAGRNVWKFGESCIQNPDNNTEDYRIIEKHRAEQVALIDQLRERDERILKLERDMAQVIAKLAASERMPTNEPPTTLPSDLAAISDLAPSSIKP